jgi:5,10-methenyltetrahydrofolate synthetase
MMTKEKDDDRVKLMESRLALPIEYRQEASSKIINLLNREVEYDKISRLHVFEPIHSIGEVGIAEFTDSIIQNNPHITLYTSRKIDGMWQEVNYKNGEQVVVNELDVAIVPMLGFDETLQRIGYGGGYYDKFLSDKPSAKKIGVCFEAGKVSRVPSEDHDIPMDVIITEKQAYRG